VEEREEREDKRSMVETKKKRTYAHCRKEKCRGISHAENE